MLRITDAAVRSCAMNYGCWYAIVRSEKTHTLARNEFQVLMCHHAVRKDTHAGLQRILRHAMNYGCGSAIGCNDWRLLIHHRAVRKNTHAGLHRILRRAMTHGCGSARLPATNSSACNELRLLLYTPSCGQKRHTRWPATNSNCWLAIVRSEKTHTLTCNEFRLGMWPHTLICNEFRLVMWLRTLRDVPTDVRVEGF